MMRYAVLLISLLTISCSNLQSSTVGATLDTLGEVIDPAYSAAMDGCTVRESSVIAEARLHGYKQAYEDELIDISRQCLKTRDAFERIRKAHDEATRLYRSGAIDKAKAELEKVMAAWSALNGGLQ